MPFNFPYIAFRSSVAATLILSLFAMDCRAWGTQGHQISASLAAAQLTSKARQEVDRLLALEPGETLSSISTWADEHRNLASAPWHYVNFPKDNCNYDPERDCPDGKCVVDATAKWVRAAEAAREIIRGPPQQNEGSMTISNLPATLPLFATPAILIQSDTSPPLCCGGARR